MTSGNEKHPWRLRVQLPGEYEKQARELFDWLRVYLIPAILHAPVRITLILEPPELDDVAPVDEEEGP